ncbi:hypothetical protein EV669_102263 [Gulbenkiania mobilis]|uniref:DUF4214 domain-containing protein n=2 Tax=Gulbenkiania mobilis TaxID=397457 RepID=A0ABY2CZR9_GULMO|nr:hypothetical protein EV669_102263 [Gulbenkiania mobilis]
MAAAAYYDAVQKLYIAYYGRPADPLGLQYWSNEIEKAGGKIDAVVNAFGNSDEAKAIYGDLGLAAQINNVYQNILGRPAETGGLTWYAQEIQAGRITLAGLAQAVIAGAKGADATVVANKLVVAKAFTDAVDDSAQSIVAYNGEAAAGIARDFLATVTADTASVTAATGNVASTVSSLNGALTGETFTLTTAVGEQVNGTAGNDVFKVVAGTDATLNTSDILDGKDGNDTLQLIVNGANTELAAGIEIKNIERVFITAAGNLKNDVDATLFQGSKEIWEVGSDKAITGLTTQTVGFQNDAGNAGDLTFDAGIATANVALNNSNKATSITVTGADLKTLNVSGSVKADNATTAGTVTLNNSTATALNLKLSSAATVEAAGLTKVTAIDASASAGSLGISDAGSVVASLKTGAGNDTVTIKTVTDKATAVNAVVDAGAGTDKITVNTSGDGATTVTAGAGDDTVTVTATSTGVFTVNAGDGNDVIDLGTRGLALTDKIDGGAGTDTLKLAGKALVAEDYALISSAVSNVEGIAFTGATKADVDASKLAQFSTLSFAGNAGDKVTEVAAAQSLVTAADLAAASKGYVNDADPTKTVYGDALTIKATGDGTITAAGASVALNVAPAKNFSDADQVATTTLKGDFKAATVTLTASQDFDATGKVTGDNKAALTFVATDAAQTTSLTISGAGTADVTGGGKLATIDASGLGGAYTVDAGANKAGDIYGGLKFVGNAAVAETIKLGAGADDITVNSTYGKLDTVVGFDTVKETATALKNSVVDTLTFGTHKFDGTAANALTAAAKVDVTGLSLEAAFIKAIQASGANSTVDGAIKQFQFNGDTYLVQDLHSNGATLAGHLDNGDLAIKIAGLHDFTTAYGTFAG